jgi:WD40 repeat protein
LLDVANPTAPPVRLLGHRARILLVTFSPDSGSLASLSEDHTIRLWDPTRPKAVLAVLHDAAGFSNMAFSPDGRWIATGSNDGTVRLWWLGVNELLRLVCRETGRNLTEDEWHTFFDGSPYRKTCPDLPAVTQRN